MNSRSNPSSFSPPLAGEREILDLHLKQKRIDVDFAHRGRHSDRVFGMSASSAERTILGAITNPATAYNATSQCDGRENACDLGSEQVQHRTSRLYAAGRQR